MDTVQPDLRAVEARRLAGLSATGAGALLILASPLYVLPGPPPTLLDAARFADFAARTSAVAITTKLIDALYIAGLVVFIGALRRLLKGKHSWTGDVVLASGTLHAALVLVAGSDYMETVISGGSRAAGMYSYISSAAGLLYSLWLILLGVWVLRNKALRCPGGPRKPQPEQARMPQQAPSDDGRLGRGGEIPSERGE
ncbi:hypothetical protein [Sinomonas sp. RB5]